MEWVALPLLAGAFLLAQDPEPEDPNAPKPREIRFKEILPSTYQGQATKPNKISTPEELAKAIPGQKDRDGILKEVNLKQEYLLLFAWAGSGQDTLTMETKKGEKGTEAVFTYKRGLTRDLRQHVKVFALPNKVKYSIEK